MDNELGTLVDEVERLQKATEFLLQTQPYNPVATQTALQEWQYAIYRYEQQLLPAQMTKHSRGFFEKQTYFLECAEREKRRADRKHAIESNAHLNLLYNPPEIINKNGESDKFIGNDQHKKESVHLDASVAILQNAMAVAAEAKARLDAQGLILRESVSERLSATFSRHFKIYG